MSGYLYRRREPGDLGKNVRERGFLARDGWSMQVLKNLRSRDIGKVLGAKVCTVREVPGGGGGEFGRKFENRQKKRRKRIDSI